MLNSEYNKLIVGVSFREYEEKKCRRWQASEAYKANQNYGRYFRKVSCTIGDICVSIWLTYK